MAPMPDVMAPASKNCNASCSLNMSVTGMESHIKIPSVIRIKLRMRMMVRGLSMFSFS